MDSVSLKQAKQIKSAVNDLWHLGTLPVLALGTLSGVLGIYWDIAWHIDKGRDSFFTPPHNFIYSAMLIVLVMAVYTLIRDRRQSHLHFKLGSLRLQPGIIIVALGAAITLFFAPADDLWHRLFGADITLWAPMHLIGLLGLTLATLGGFIATQIEADLNPEQKRLFQNLSIYFAIMFLAWCMLLLAEYEFGVPVFPMWVGIALLSALPSFILFLIAKLRPFLYAATLTSLGFTLFRLLIAAWLIFSDSRLDWAGETRPAIPLLIVTGILADWLVQRKVNWLLAGLILAVSSFLSNWLLVLTLGNGNWYLQALAWGLVGGLVLSVLLSRLAVASARALDLRS
ncbi:MAG: hypothetical protein KC422_00935 [Trueperaceae bacterium]|nr:hypothetical protein [Trueperaceae bacterium]